MRSNIIRQGLPQPLIAKSTQSRFASHLLTHNIPIYSTDSGKVVSMIVNVYYAVTAVVVVVAAAAVVVADTAVVVSAIEDGISQSTCT